MNKRQFIPSKKNPNIYSAPTKEYKKNFDLIVWEDKEKKPKK